MMPEGSPGSLGRFQGLPAGQWSADPDTGVVALTEAALARLINPDPIDKWYILDPEPIARGQFAVVYHCRHRITGEEFAAKFSSRWRLGADCTADIVHEIAICVMLRPTPRAVQLQDVFKTDAEFVLVMEYAAGGDLQTLLDEDMVPYERDVISFTRQLLEGLVFIHDQNIVHLDIKPQNLVLMGEFPECAVKLCDFEISRKLTPGREVREILGTPDYVAPEIILYEPITTRTDMWNSKESKTVSIVNDVGIRTSVKSGGVKKRRKVLVFYGLRMSAKECLDHPWMKADLSKAKIPLQPPRKLSSPTSPLTTSTPVSSPQPRSALPSTSSTPTNQTLISALSDIVTSDARDLFNRSHGSHSNTPVLPPIHPLSGQRSSAVNSTYSSTNSLYRGGSRQSLDRARSLSKSREVLFERMQMSNQKKTLSKSRERLHDGRLSLSRSGEDIWSYKSFSHSEESLSMFSWLNQDDSIYKSCNSVFLPMLPMLEENGMSGRLYKSLASIDKIDEVGTESNAGNDRQGIFDSRFSINDEDYNNLITRYNTAVNSHQESPPRGRSMEERPRRMQAEGWHRECCQGERGGASVCDRRCSRSSRQEEPPKIPKTNRGERVKRDRHNRRKGKKEKEKQRTEKEKQRTEREKHPCERDKQRPERTPRGTHSVEHETSKSAEKPSASARAPSPGKRRGSVSHIEQRIQERHERQQERLERQEQKEKLERRGSGKIGTPTTKRRNSAEEKKPQAEKNRKNKTCESTKSSDTNACNRLRSTSPSKKPKVNKSKSISSDGSPASSLESVKELDLKRTTPKSSAFREPKKSPRGSTSGGASSAPEPRERRAEMDEAYVSLEEPVDDGIFSRSESMDSSNTVESDHTVHATDTSSDTLDLTVTAYSVSEYELNQDCDISGIFPSLEENEVDKTAEENTEDEKSAMTCVKASSSESMAELTAIHEEEEDEKSVFTRSVSTSSDIGSMLSESSEVEKDDSSTKNQDSDASAALSWRQRGRSMSMQPCDPPPFSHLHLCRSNSFNLVMPIGGFGAAPWGDVCDGAIRRALEMFKLNSSDLTSSGRNMQERRSSLHSQ
ncbi:zinc finger CCCH domain-containing protein 13-like [Penaeus chinensis]|uniref:zinc finger CCCH domain-containing protein 13-like n=1 Tax=Penaeus chinensis TaxID=139456 RepID=UPI001FB6A71D|nr:zinc finger CCCH domain-containing protein 13-like [Penaeus chinensis]